MILDERFTVDYIQREASLIIQLCSPHKRKNRPGYYSATDRDKRIIENLWRYR
jgi:hypothetical protein